MTNAERGDLKRYRLGASTQIRKSLDKVGKKKLRGIGFVIRGCQDAITLQDLWKSAGEEWKSEKEKSGR